MSLFEDRWCDRCHGRKVIYPQIIQAHYVKPLTDTMNGKTTWNLCPHCAQLILDVLQCKIEPENMVKKATYDELRNLG